MDVVGILLSSIFLKKITLAFFPYGNYFEFW